MSPQSQNPTDKEVRNYVKDQAAFVECWDFETLEGDLYTMCCDQDGAEWIED